MAEQMMVVCDDCSAPAVATVLVRITNDGGKSYEKDVCDEHKAGMFNNTRPSRRGRKRVIGTAEQRRSPKRTTSKRSTRKSTKRSTSKRSTAKKSTRRRRRQPTETPEPVSVSAASETSESSEE